MDKQDERQARLEALGEQIVTMLASLSDLDREDVMAVVTAAYCRHCWTPTPGDRICYCCNDE